MGTGVYFFRGQQYARYDRGNDTLDEGYPVDTGPNWPGLSDVGFDHDIDTALNLQQGFVYFFKGDSYVRYSLDADKVDFGPARIADHWPGLAARGFDSALDAAVCYGNGFAYFFKGSSYVRYNLGLKPGTTEGADSGPTAIGGGWSGMDAVGFGSDIDTAITWGDGNTYFFKGGQYVRYNHADDAVAPGYPLATADHWPGMGGVGFADGFSAAVDVLTPIDLWLDSAERRPAAANGPAYIDLPWRGVLHTTEGTAVDGALATFDAKKVWPTLTIDPDHLRIIEHYPVSRGARALTDSLTPQNAARCVQIEIVGRAVDAPGWAPERLAFIRDVMRQVEDLVPIPRTSGRSFLDAAGVNTHPGNRMSVDEWKRFSGWCGHQHVPGNTHWDPGGIDIDTLLFT